MISRILAERIRSSKWRSQYLALAIVALVAVSILFGVSLWLDNIHSKYGMMLIADGISLGSNGSVTFNMSNTHDIGIAITSVKAYHCAISFCSPITGANATYLETVSLSANNVVPARGGLILTLQFQGINWLSGERYGFDILDSNGDQVGVVGCLSGC